MNQLTISNEYDDAITQFLQDIGLAADSKDQPSTPERRLRAIVSSLAELFSTSEPTISDDLDATLRQIARDAKLSNIMRERALYRLYLVTSTYKKENGVTVPMWYGLVDDEGVLITTQEDFIRLFTKQSGIGRASTFRRIRVYNQLAKFGIKGQDAWLRVLQMPYTIQELMEGIAVWNRSELVKFNQEVARSITEKMLPSSLDALNDALAHDDQDRVMQNYAPAIRKMITEMESYKDAKEALEHIKHDILGVPTVSYRWLPEAEMIMATTTVPVIDNGNLVAEQRTETTIYIDSIDPPSALMDDLFKRLPIINRHELPK